MYQCDPTLMANNDTSSSSTDFSDSDYLPDSQPLSTNRKRKTNSKSSQSKKKKTKSIIMSLEDKKEHLSLLDPEEKLAVHEYINSYNSDVLVKTFVDMVLEHRTLPLLPSQDKIKEWLKHNVHVEVTPDVMKMLISNFMKYFHRKYFTNNVTKATEQNKALFNPKNDFWIPGFQDLPEETLQQLHESKMGYVMKVQQTSIRGSLFSIQMLVLRNIDLVMSYIKGTLKLTCDTDITLHLEYILALAYTTAKIEFPKTYRVKVTDWASYESKVKFTQPAWRKDNKEPTSYVVSNLASSIHAQIDEKKIKFTGNEISHMEEEYMKTPYKMPHHKKFQRRRPTQPQQQQAGFSKGKTPQTQQSQSRVFAKVKRRGKFSQTEQTAHPVPSTQTKEDVISSII